MIKNYLALLALPGLLIGCSMMREQPEEDKVELLPADDMMSGPGLFTGDNGAFMVLGGKKKKSATTKNAPNRPIKSVSNMDLNETSRVIDEKLRQLEQDQIELELLKQELDKKIRN
jgi:hypothetical protein